MKCKYCESTWDTTAQVKKCPFCGKNLDENTEYTISSALAKVVEDCGLEILCNSRKITAYIMDYVKGDERNKKLFRIAGNVGVFNLLYEAKIDKGQAELLIGKSLKILEEEAFLSTENAVHIMKILTEGLALGFLKIDDRNENIEIEILHYAEEDKQINIWEEYKKQYQELQGKEDNKAAVMGIGGAGLNFINRMRMDNQFLGIDFIGVNTDKQELQLCRAQKLLLVGEKITLGLGTGAKYEIAEKAFEEDEHKIKALLKGIDILFIICGIGGGTGAGGIPIVANIAKQMGILTIAIVMKPFRFEAKIRHQNANHSLEQLKKNAGVVIAISNDVSLKFREAKTMPDALKMIDEVCGKVIKGIINSVNYNSIKNISLDELQKITAKREPAYVGVGTAKGKDKIKDALNSALNSPWLENLTYNVSKIFIHLSGDIMESDIEKVKCYVREQIGDISIISSACREENEYREVSIVLIMFEANEKFNIKSSIKLNSLKIPDFLKK